jgi:hypothetical protein
VPDGARFEIAGGMNTRLAPDAIPAGKYAYLQNVRRYLQGRITGRAVQTDPLVVGGGALSYPDPVHSLRRLNDTTPGGPADGYSVVVGAGTNGYVNATQIQTGLSGKPLSMMPFRPSASPQPWMYVGDANKAFKVNANGTAWKTGIVEPQVAPAITASSGSGPYWVTYRYVYRSSVTGAVSNPSPESVAVQIAQATITKTLVGTNTGVTYTAGQYEPDPGGGTFLRTVGGVASGILTDYVIARNFALGVPANTHIDGIQVTLNWAGENDGTGLLQNVALYYQGSTIGLVKSPLVENQQFPTPPPSIGFNVAVGGNTDTWGADLTPIILNDSTFGFGVQIQTIKSGSTNRSFLYSFQVTVYYSNPSAGATATVSSDPQVDKIDFYRSDARSDTFTYVGTVANTVATLPSTSPVLNDTLSDLAIASNPILQFDNFEPFPSIDLPHKGIVNVAANGVVTYVSGDPFNARWLPGTVILIGGSSVGSAATAFTLYNRPTPPTLIAANITYGPVTGLPIYSYPPTGSGFTYEILEPTLAAQPMPAIWGPTDNVNFYFGCGDPLRPGVLYWSKGNNFDSAPDTNQQDVTSPSEPLMNGTIVAGLGMVFSTERAWLIYPTFTSALATVQGTTGSQWNLVEAAITRGLYMRYAICTDGGGRVFYRAKDCIAMTAGGQPEESVTDDIFNLFPHEGLLLAPVTIGNYTVYPPDDTKPDKQTLCFAKNCLYYDYQDTTGTPRTLVYDVEGKGWSVDTYGDLANVHYWEEGMVNGVLLGTQSKVRALDGRGFVSTQTSVVLTPSINGGDPRVQKILADLFVRAVVPAPDTVTVAAWSQRYTQTLTGFTGTLPAGTGASQDYLVDFTGVANNIVTDVGLAFTWNTGSGIILDYWQVDWSQTPEQVGGWKTDLTGYGGESGGGLHGWLHVGWFNLAYKSTTPVTVTALTDQGQTITMTFPSTGGIMKKQYQIVPANKFKLIGWSVTGGGSGFALDAADSEMAIKGWGETGAYHILRPFAGQSPQKGTEV